MDPYLSTYRAEPSKILAQDFLSVYFDFPSFFAGPGPGPGGQGPRPAKQDGKCFFFKRVANGDPYLSLHNGFKFGILVIFFSHFWSRRDQVGC